jgi:hypothetical protein
VLSTVPDILRGLPAELAAQLAQAGIVKASTTATAMPTAAPVASAPASQVQAPSRFYDLMFQSTPTVNGSHANGLASVPFDGYIAELHRDERVLTAAENRSYKRDGGDQVSTTALVAEARAIREEIATLRKEQNTQTGAIINGTHQASDRNADRVTQGALDAAKDAIWAAMSKPKLN